MNAEYNISEISQRSGIPKDLLRQWERRYGFPNPSRDANGDRLYSSQHLDKLVLIRQLVDQGKRPGKLVSLDLGALRGMLAEPPRPTFDRDELIQRLKSCRASDLIEWLESQVGAAGLRGFVHGTMAPAMCAVGDAWAAGNLAIHEEHLFSEAMKRVVRRHLAEQTQAGGEPRVMLTTVPGEQHSLGLLMVEVLMRLGGAEVISFGTEMPFEEIRNAAESHKVAVIGLSFSGDFKTGDALVLLSGLRQIVRPEIAIWVGGAAFANRPALPEGVDLLYDLRAVEQVVATWRCRVRDPSLPELPQ